VEYTSIVAAVRPLARHVARTPAQSIAAAMGE
jgi:hypothetical protein